MPIRAIKPTTNARRKMSVLDTQALDKVKRDKNLTAGKKRLSGRDGAGCLVVAHRGGGAKRLYRFIDNGQTSRLGEKAVVESIEYDPNRSAFIAKVVYENGDKSYILAPEGLKKETSIICDEKTPVRTGNRMRLINMPLATQIYNIELTSGKGGQLAKSAGSFATLLGFDDKYALLRMPSGETRKVLASNYASIGIVSNIDHNKVIIGKAGRVRWMRRRPVVLGKSKNPVDHPHGGGEGHTSIGLKYPKTPWGAPALGRRTRNKKKLSSELIINRRKR